MAQTRQIHLDFHCSEFIKNIGNQFDAKSFQVCLKKQKLIQLTYLLSAIIAGVITLLKLVKFTLI